MKLLKKLEDGFATLRVRDQVIAAAAIAVCLVLGGNLALVKPQLIELDKLKHKEATHRKELASLKQQLDIIKSEAEQGIDPFSDLRATLDAHRQKLKEIEALFPNERDSTVSELSALVRSLIRANRGLVLVTLKTLPGAVFYAPPEKSKPKGSDKSAVSAELKKAMASVNLIKEEPTSQEVALMTKTIYKHGVEVTVKGTYPVLLTYLNEMQRFPKRIFWSEAKLDATNHREAVLKLMVFMISEQPNPPLN